MIYTGFQASNPVILLSFPSLLSFSMILSVYLGVIKHFGTNNQRKIQLSHELQVAVSTVGKEPLKGSSGSSSYYFFNLREKKQLFYFDLTFFWQNIFCWNFEDHQNPLWNAQIRGFRSIEQILEVDVPLEPYQLVSMLVKNGNLRRNSYVFGSNSVGFFVVKHQKCYFLYSEWFGSIQQHIFGG